MFTESVSVSRGVKNLSCSYQAYEWKSMDSISEISYYLKLSTNVRCYYRVIYNNFVFQQDIAPGRSCIQHSPTAAAVQSSQLSPELWPHNSAELNSTNCEI